MERLCDGLKQAYGGKQPKNRQTGIKPMQHGEEEQVYCIETIKSDGGRQCVGARKGMSEKGEECSPPYLRACTHNGKMLCEEEKEGCQSE